MKTCALVLCLLCGPAMASDWTTGDSALEAGYLALHVADWGQTRYISSHPRQFTETNSLLGENPTRRDVNAYFLAAGLLHAGVAYMLPHKWRTGFQLVTIGIEAGVVAKNNRLGVQIKF